MPIVFSKTITLGWSWDWTQVLSHIKPTSHLLRYCSSVNYDFKRVHNISKVWEKRVFKFWFDFPPNIERLLFFHQFCPRRRTWNVLGSCSKAKTDLTLFRSFLQILDFGGRRNFKLHRYLNLGLGCFCGPFGLLLLSILEMEREHFWITSLSFWYWAWKSPSLWKLS